MQTKLSLKKIGLVDDETLFRRIISAALQQKNIEICLEAGDGWEMTQKISPDNLPDLILLDYLMPRMDGLQSLKWLKTHYPQIPVWILSSLPARDMKEAFMGQGASGYLQKSDSLEKMMENIEQILDRLPNQPQIDTIF